MILIEKSRLNLIGAYGALGLVVLLLQTTLLSGLRLLHVTPVMTVAAVVCVALFEGEVSGGLFGLFLGLALDATVSANTGASALTLMLVGALAGLVSRLFMLPGFFSALVLYFASYAALIGGDLLLRLLVTADLAGFFRVAEFYTTTALVSLFYLPLFYCIARRMNLSFGGDRSME